MMCLNVKLLKDLIYSPETAKNEAISKIESHTPRIEAPDRVRSGEEFSVKVSVGPHPSTIEHYIRKIELYFYEEGRRFNPILLASIELTPIYSEPKVEIKIKKSGVLYALSYCNLHGLWEGKKEIIVE